MTMFFLEQIKREFNYKESKKHIGPSNTLGPAACKTRHNRMKLSNPINMIVLSSTQRLIATLIGVEVGGGLLSFFIKVCLNNLPPDNSAIIRKSLPNSILDLVLMPPPLVEHHVIPCNTKSSKGNATKQKPYTTDVLKFLRRPLSKESLLQKRLVPPLVRLVVQGLENIGNIVPSLRGLQTLPESVNNALFSVV